MGRQAHCEKQKGNISRCGIYCLRLPTDAKLLDDGLVTIDITGLDIVEQPPALADDLQQTPATVMVLLVDFEVLGQVRDPLGQDGNLNLGRTGIAVMTLVAADNLLLFFSYEHAHTSFL